MQPHQYGEGVFWTCHQGLVLEELVRKVFADPLQGVPPAGVDQGVEPAVQDVTFRGTAPEECDLIPTEGYSGSCQMCRSQPMLKVNDVFGQKRLLSDGDLGEVVPFHIATPLVVDRANASSTGGGVQNR